MLNKANRSKTKVKLKYISNKIMKKLHLICFAILIIIGKTQAQKIQSYNDSKEIQRITKVLNVSGEYLYKSGQQQLNGFLCVGAGALISIGGALFENTGAMYTGAGVTFAAIPLFISSAVNKKKSGKHMKDFKLDETPLIPISESTIQKTDSSSTRTNQLKSEPKYKVGQVVYFYKKNQLTEAKIILIDKIGLRVEFFDEQKNRSKSRFIDFNKVYTEKP